MYAKTGISSDSARKNRANLIARLIAVPCRRLFQAKAMPELEMPVAVPIKEPAFSILR
jgi:hypothetical protein